ncbi:hypothetical protein G3480_02900 [Thiorhodococcus mannitoliphagus]|uniref:Uncharacterized protein n=1 Tax=Thiorhodococcus mannitoliphagus TaxID=329406 RepID=A0A6P1DP01_9GAMM|nr:hypothetical protein [Thiorhodococcus mannitoliphagus]NEX19270.1 hypothetical protein [Thiorhodococcus mannitoliphagus]
MALDQKKLQKKRAKRDQKRRQTKPAASGLRGALSAAREWASVSKAPIVDTFVPASLFEQGIGTVWLSRRLLDGRYAVVGILVDTYCLGVKNALYKIVDAAEYSTVLAHIHGNPTESVEVQHPSCARKLVEAAVAYAKDLGFEPHADYRIARLIFGDIDADACPERFTFGKDGKPFYVNGPNDTPAIQRRILKQLERRCGQGGYHYMMMLDPDEFA